MQAHDQTENIETLNDLIDDAGLRLKSDAAAINPEIRRRLEFRVLEIRELMLTTLKFNSRPPKIDDVPEFMRIMEDVKKRIEQLKADPDSCGKQIINLGS